MSDEQTVVTQEQEENNFIAEFETMDLSKLRDKSFLLAVSTGDRKGFRFLCSTIKGPYNFVEMCEEVGIMWNEQQHHARVMITNTDRKKRLEVLDENTIDYIECHYADIISREFINEMLEEDFTCEAGIVVAQPELEQKPAAEE